MLSREKAQELLDKYITTPWMKLHLRETEVIMRALAQHFHEDEDLWGITGLIHDLDWDTIDQNDPKDHGTLSCELLKKECGEDDIPDEMIHAILAHVEDLGTHGVKRESKFDYALAAAETLSGFIVACALVQPDKKLASLKVESIKKKFKKKEFARNVRREIIYDIDKTGLDLDEFVEMALKAVGGISDEIGL